MRKARGHLRQNRFLESMAFELGLKNKVDSGRLSLGRDYSGQRKMNSKRQKEGARKRTFEKSSKDSSCLLYPTNMRECLHAPCSRDAVVITRDTRGGR